MANENGWVNVEQNLLNYPLDTRSNPASVEPGVFRWKLNMAINSSGRLTRRTGFSALNFGAGTNADHHSRSGTREPISFIYENSAQDGTRQLFDGTETTVSLLNDVTGTWSDILTGMSGGNWKAAGLTNYVVFTNNVDKPKLYTIGGAAVDLTEATTVVSADVLPISKAKLAFEFAGVIVLMNVEVDDTTRHANRVHWSDYRKPDAWDPATPDSVTGYQDLDEGETILNAVQFAGTIWIFTDRAIWKMYAAAADAEVPFGFTRWYSEPRNRIGCLHYENGLVSTGKELFWLGRETIYWCNQYSTAPTSADWLLKASGTMYQGDNKIDEELCSAPQGYALASSESSAREVWFSYPRTGLNTGNNDYTLVLSFNTDSLTAPYQTADYVDHGFTAFGSFARNVTTGSECKYQPVFIAASAEDYCLKSMGDVYYREMVALLNDDVTQNLPATAATTTEEGYSSIVRGLCPFPYPRREKRLRKLLLEHETTDSEAYVRLKTGNSYTIQDCNLTSGRCRVLWHETNDDKPLACPVSTDPTNMLAQNLRSDEATEWPIFEEGNYIYYELKVISPTGGIPTGGESAWLGLVWEVLVKP